MTKNKRIFHTTMILILMFGFGFLPTFSTVTPIGMKILGIFLGCIYAWTLGWSIWPSILALIAIGLTGYDTIAGMFANAYGNTTLHLVLFSLLFCFAIDRSGLLIFIANWILNRKFVQKGPWMLCLAFWIAACVGGFVTANALPVTILLWTLFYEVANKLKIPPYDKFASIVLIGIVVTAYLGNVTAPYCPFAQIIFGAALANMSDFSMNYMAYILLMIILDLILLPLLLLGFRLIFKPKISYDFDRLSINKEKITLTNEQKIVSIAVIILCLLMIIPNILPKEWIFTQFLVQIGTNGIFAGMCVVLAFITYKDKPILDLNAAMSYGVPWNLYFLVATAVAISSVIVSEGTGISELLISILKPILSGTSPFVFCFLIMIIGIVLTNIVNNIVCGTILIPIVITFSSMLNTSPITIIALLVMVLMVGIVLPSGSVLGALLHGNDKWLKTKDIYIFTIFSCLIIALVCAIIGYPIGNILFNM